MTQVIGLLKMPDGGGNSVRDDVSDGNRDAVELLSEASIKKQLRSEALQNPRTLIPLAVTALSLLQLLDLIPIPVATMWALISLIGSLVVGAGSFFWIYSIRHDDAWKKLVDEIMEQQTQLDQKASKTAVRRSRENLKNGFTGIDSEAGMKALTGLNNEYEQLQHDLSRQGDTASLSITQIPGLAEETYLEGLNVLGSGLRLSTAIHASKKGRLEEEIAQIEREIETLGKDPNKKSG